MNTNPDSAAAPEEGVAKALPGELEALKADLASQKDRSLRLAADFDNFRKRTAQEADRRAAEQKEAFICELLPVIDNLERALASDPSASPQQLREGVQITLQQLNQLLRHRGIEPEDSLGQPFDPIATKPSGWATTHPNRTTPSSKFSNGVTAAATKSFVPPNSSSTI
jgi:molecular chaperone GrpE